MNTDDELFEWSASTNSPYMYPIDLMPSILIFDEENDGYIPLMSVTFSRGSKWGRPGTDMGPSKKALPNKLLITWLS